VDYSKLFDFLPAEMEYWGIPGFSYGVMKDGKVLTKGGCGYGDSRINMRGFESSNIAVMINGVPINDMEWGGVYWSNWAGLAEVTRSIGIVRCGTC